MAKLSGRYAGLKAGVCCVGILSPEKEDEISGRVQSASGVGGRSAFFPAPFLLEGSPAWSIL